MYMHNRGAARAQRGFGVDFSPENSSHWIDALWVVLLEVPRTEMVSLQVFVDRHRNTGVQSSNAYQGRAPRETIGKKFPELLWILRF